MKEKEAQQILHRSKPLQRTMKKRNKTNQFLLLNPDQLFQELSIKKNIKNQLVCLYDWIKHIFFKYVNNR